jgi:hypothetical protein
VKVLFFSPHAEIWRISFPEALIAEALAQGGDQVVYAGCGGQFERFCVPMSSHGMTPATDAVQRHAICQRCRGRAFVIQKKFGLTGPLLTDLIDEPLRQQAERMLSSDDRQALIDLELDGIQIGKIASYQMMIRTKRLDLDFCDKEWGDYLAELRNTIFAWQAGKLLLDTERPDRVVVYNALYSVHRIVCKLAERRGIPQFFLHAGGNLSNGQETLWIGRGDTFSFFPHLIEQWPRFAKLACTDNELGSITDHYLELLQGNSPFVYSRPKSIQRVDVRQTFGVKSHQRLLVATLGSYDEEIAAEMVGARVHSRQPLFRTQVDWINALVSYAKRRPEIFLVVRVHPREFPNKREGILSQHAKLMQQVFSGFPDNVAVNWPNDGIAMYDLADQTDVFLNSWSSVGKEMALLGIPVVLYAPELAFYPPDLGYAATTEETYFAAIEQALVEGWSFERIRRAYRWYVFEFVRATLFIGDSYPKKTGIKRGFWQRVVEQMDHRVLPEFEQKWDCIRKHETLGSAQRIRALIHSGAASIVDLMEGGSSSSQAVEGETASLRRQLKRLANALYPMAGLRSQSRLYRALCGLNQSGALVAR